MFVSDCLDLNSQGHLTIGGVDTLELAETYGTPVYVMDEDQIRRNCRKFKDSIDRYYEGRGLCCYASKAFSCKEIYRIVESEGLGADIVSLVNCIPPCPPVFRPKGSVTRQQQNTGRAGSGHRASCRPGGDRQPHRA